MGTKRIRLIIESDVHHISLVGMAVSCFTESLLRGQMDPFHIEICTVEAVTNSIKHACGHGSSKEIEVIFALSEDSLTINVCDEGMPLDSAILKSKGTETFDCDPDDLDSLAEGGRGLAIIKEIMDEVSYDTHNGKNCLTLVKQLTGKAV
jgi:serine/threonine-protein kinase RsbW